MLFLSTVTAIPNGRGVRRFYEKGIDSREHKDFLFRIEHLLDVGDFLEDGSVRNRRSSEERTEGGNHNDHLFYGENLWGKAYHDGSRKRRSVDEEGEGSDHNEHLFHGEHLWGLEDFHEPSGRV